MKFVSAGTTRLQKKYLLGARVAPVFAALAAALVPSYSFAQGGDDCWGPTQLSASAPDAESRDSITLLSNEETARHCHVWTPLADQGLFWALRGSWVRSCLRPHMRAPPSIVFLPMAIRGELSFPQGIPC